MELLKNNKNCEACQSIHLWIYQGEEEYPLIVDIPDVFSLQDRNINDIKKISITLFPYRIDYWSSKEEFESKVKDKENPFELAHNFFIPSGTFDPGENPDFEPSASCMCSWCFMYQIMGKNTCPVE